MSYEELRKDFSRTLKRSMRFYRVDLHVHSMMSHDFAATEPDEADKAATAESIVRQSLKQGLYVLAITDHNHCRATAAVKKAAAEIKEAGLNEYDNNNLLVLPAVEITIRDDGEVFHVLCIFPENMTEVEIERILGDVGLEPKPEDRKAQSQVTKIKGHELCERVRGLGGITIAAHINDPKGFRDSFKDALKPAELDARIHSLFNAVEIKKAEERRHFEDIEVGGKKVSIACLIDSDAHHIRDIGAKPNITRVKMGTPSFKDLRRAISDPKTRIRFEDDVKGRYPLLRGIRIEGGFLDGFKRGFSDNLNCLIGGRGVGKSSIIEMLRFVLGTTVPDTREDEVDGMLKRVLGNGKVTALFEDATGTNFILERALGDPGPKVFSLDGTPIAAAGSSLPSSIRVEVYGWSEIERIAKDPDEQLDLIDGFVDGVGTLKKDETGILSKLSQGRDRLLSLRKQAADKATGLDALQGLKMELEVLAKKGIDEAEQKDAKVLKEETILAEVDQALSQFEIGVSGLSSTSGITSCLASLKAAIDTDLVLNKSELLRLQADLAAAIAEGGKLSAALAQLKIETAGLKSIIDTHRETLVEIHTRVRKDFQSTLEGTQESDVKKAIEKRAQLRKKISELEAQKAEHEKLQGKVAEEEKLRQAELTLLQDARKKLFELRDNKIKQIRDNLNFRKAGVSISVEISQAGNRQAFQSVLESSLTGISIRWKDRKTASILASHLDPLAFGKAIRSGDTKSLLVENKENEKLGISQEDADNLLAHYREREEMLLKIEELPCPDRPRIFLSDGNNKRAIEELSPGQRCTALLPIIFLQSTAPLVIDQPEDNLDNKLVFDLVVDTLRHLKEKRQILVATHNPNVPVSGDAELIMVFQSDGSRGEVADAGSIDDTNIILQVKKIMEGGEEAFLVRQKKYSEGLSNTP